MFFLLDLEANDPVFTRIRIAVDLFFSFFFSFVPCEGACGFDDLCLHIGGCMADGYVGRCELDRNPMLLI
jgi:hypothetical protein